MTSSLALLVSCVVAFAPGLPPGTPAPSATPPGTVPSANAPPRAAPPLPANPPTEPGSNAQNPEVHLASETDREYRLYEITGQRTDRAYTPNGSSGNWSYSKVEILSLVCDQPCGENLPSRAAKRYVLGPVGKLRSPTTSKSFVLPRGEQITLTARGGSHGLAVGGYAVLVAGLAAFTAGLIMGSIQLSSKEPSYPRGLAPGILLGGVALTGAGFGMRFGARTRFRVERQR